jgi:hypothetical protein
MFRSACFLIVAEKQAFPFKINAHKPKNKSSPPPQHKQTPQPSNHHPASPFLPSCLLLFLPAMHMWSWWDLPTPQMGMSALSIPAGCGNVLVRGAPNRGVGLILRLPLVAPAQVALYTINPDGSDGCRVGFTKSIFARQRGEFLDGKLVIIIDVYHEQHENVACRADHHRNCGFAQGEVLDAAQTNAFIAANAMNNELQI